MRKLIFIISLLLGSASIFAQNIIHFCEGDSAQNFAVPLSIGSTYQWSVNGNANIATITPAVAAINPPPIPGPK